MTIDDDDDDVYYDSPPDLAVMSAFYQRNVEVEVFEPKESQIISDTFGCISGPLHQHFHIQTASNGLDAPHFRITFYASYSSETKRQKRGCCQS